VRADGAIAAGMDGKVLVLHAPLRFAIRPGALRVRIACTHPGASPSAAMPDTLLGTVKVVLAIAAGRQRPRPPPHCWDDHATQDPPADMGT
jgi:hypothetical protein